MKKSLRNYFRRLAEGHENGVLSQILHPLLDVASGAYRLGLSAAQLAYQKKVLPRKRLPYPVISVGNLTWGGTGKTPFVEYLARRTGERQRTPLVLTRGYSHDEAEQFRHHLPRAVIGVGKDRLKVAEEIAKKQKVDLAILDDGLQHWPIERDMEIIMVNALNPFGNGKVIPRGILREPLSALKRASVVVLSHVNLALRTEVDALKERVRAAAPEAHIVEAYLEPLFFYRAKKRARVPLEKLRQERVTTFSAVGAPRSFQLLLAHHQIKPVRNFEFTDHHPFTKNELQEIKDISTAASTGEIVTTEKDYYRSPALIADILNPLVLATRLRISSGEEALNDRLFRLLGVTSR